ncbi:hypothetical protein [Vibrio phage VCPH]|nr:hypothetical protein [Vibrio phage VCPH]
MIKFNQATQLKSLDEIFTAMRERNSGAEYDQDPTNTEKYYLPKLSYFVVTHPAYGITILDVDLDVMGIYSSDLFGLPDNPVIPQDLKNWFGLDADESFEDKEWHAVTVKSLEITSE